MRYLLHQSDPNLPVLACICIFRHQITRHHSKVYSYFVEIAMSPPNLIRCNNLGDEDYLHLPVCICKASCQFVKANATKTLSTEQPALCKLPDEEHILFYSNTPVIHTHISGYFLPNTVSACMNHPNYLRWYVPHHSLYIPLFPHGLDLYLHPSQRK